MLLPVVTLKTPRNSRHPWIYRKMVQAPRGIALEPGTLVEVREKGGAFAGRGFYHPENTIAVRLLTERRADAVDEDFFLGRLARACGFRERTLGLSRVADSYRLANAEADGLPGLVVDKFAGVILVEPRCAGWLHIMPWIVDGLAELHPGAVIAVRADGKSEEKDGVSYEKWEKRHPVPGHADIAENGIRYRVDFADGHKTGFFLDQRDNRRKAGALAKGLDVLDLCCYTGGFALSAWKGGARSVAAVDLDEKAVAAAEVNIGLNGAGAVVSARHADAFDELRARGKNRHAAGMVVLDPPKLAAGPDDVETALKTYFDLNSLAVRAVAPGGLFITCSCSGAVSADRWLQTVRRAAAAADKTLAIFDISGPGADHPVSSDFPQGQYLKVLFARVD